MASLDAKLNSLQNVFPTGGIGQQGKLDPGAKPGSGPSFKDVLGSQIEGALPNMPSAAPQALKFSSHAVDRMRTRGIHFDQDTMGKIENAVSRAASKGAKETLLLTDNSALIVSVKNNTVVTVMDKQGLKDNVFTNIDSTVVI